MIQFPSLLEIGGYASDVCIIYGYIILVNDLLSNLRKIKRRQPRALHTVPPIAHDYVNLPKGGPAGKPSPWGQATFARAFITA